MGDKIYIQSDWTKNGVANELEALGVKKVTLF